MDKPISEMTLEELEEEIEKEKKRCEELTEWPDVNED